MFSFNYGEKIITEENIRSDMYGRVCMDDITFTPLPYPTLLILIHGGSMYVWVGEYQR